MLCACLPASQYHVMHDGVQPLDFAKSDFFQQGRQLRRAAASRLRLRLGEALQQRQQALLNNRQDQASGTDTEPN